MVAPPVVVHYEGAWANPLISLDAFPEEDMFSPLGAYVVTLLCALGLSALYRLWSIVAYGAANFSYTYQNART